jgi:hypothetical protein
VTTSWYVTGQILLLESVLGPKVRGPGRVGFMAAMDVATAGWALSEPAAGCDAGLSQNTSVLSLLRARVWGDGAYRHFDEFKSDGYIFFG